MKIERRHLVFGIALLCFLFFCGSGSSQCLCATDIRLNGSLNAGVIVPGSPVAITYVLNENASAGAFGSNFLRHQPDLDDRFPAWREAPAHRWD